MRLNRESFEILAQKISKLICMMWDFSRTKIKSVPRYFEPGIDLDFLDWRIPLKKILIEKIQKFPAFIIWVFRKNPEKFRDSVNGMGIPGKSCFKAISVWQKGVNEKIMFELYFFKSKV